MLAVQSLISLQQVEDEESIAEAIAEEYLRRDELFRQDVVKKVNILRDVAKEAFNFTAEQQWFAEVTKTIANEVDCKLQCVDECFTVADNSTLTQTIIEQCVIPKCGCHQPAFPDNYAVNLASVSDDSMTFDDFLIDAQNKRLMEESMRDLAGNAECRFECGLDCLSDNFVPFEAKEVCMKRACGCTLNLFYEARQCDIPCAKNCAILPFEKANVCMHQCGCGDKPAFT
jgi:hypothetical protein